MAGMVSDAGRRVVDRIRGYEVVVNESLRLLADHGFVPPAELDVPPAAPTAARRRRASIRPAWARR